MLENFMEKLTLTGSRAANLNNNSDSDWDYFCSIKTAKLIKLHIIKNNISFIDLCDDYEEDEDNNIADTHETNIKFKIKNKTYNIIGLDEIKLKKWVFATRALKKLSEDSDLIELMKIRKNRVTLFRMFCNEIIDGYK
jgi:hypothetical protein